MSRIGTHRVSWTVWDRWVRLTHWSLVLALAVAAVTGFLGGASWLALHLGGGLLAAALVLARIVWGFLGSTHARFADFLPTPRGVLAHLKGQDRHHLGHNPLGALMVFALLAAVLALALTGLAVLGGVFRVGPLAADLGTAQGFPARDLHEALAIGLLALVALHLGGVFVESRRSGENLVRAMITGEKRNPAGGAPQRPAVARGGLAIALVAAGLAGLAALNAGMSARAAGGLPVADLPPAVTGECGACHMVYHPSLLSAPAWSGLIATLDDHFGEDASLPAATAAEIERFLTSHAAETADTLPARAIGRGVPATPFRPSAATAWQRLHADLPEALFAGPAVGGRANCLACHRDAESGRFSPFAIALPKETPR